MRPAIFLTFATLLLGAPLAATAEDEPVLPPPEIGDEAESPTPTPTPRKSNDDVDLKREFESPEGDVTVEVRSYQREDGSTVDEYSVGGQVYMLRVQPAKGLPAYYLYDDDGDGVFERRLPGGYKRLSPPRWVIHRF